mgnify:FL=1
MGDPMFCIEKTSPLSILIYLYILIFCAGVVAPLVAGVVAVPVAPRRIILLIIIVINYRNYRCTLK